MRKGLSGAERAGVFVVSGTGSTKIPLKRIANLHCSLNFVKTAFYSTGVMGSLWILRGLELKLLVVTSVEKQQRDSCKSPCFWSWFRGDAHAVHRLSVKGWTAPRTHSEGRGEGKCLPPRVTLRAMHPQVHQTQWFLGACVPESIPCVCLTHN